jgi:hypothetical protein
MVSSTGGPALTIIRIRRGFSNWATSSWGVWAGVVGYGPLGPAFLSYAFRLRIALNRWAHP